MLHSNRSGGDEESIVTRPQLINTLGSRPITGEMMQSERIANPHLSSFMNGSDPEPASSASNGSNGHASDSERRTTGAYRQRRNTGVLTRVSRGELLKRRILGDALLNSTKLLNSLFSSKKEEPDPAQGLSITHVTASFKRPGAERARKAKILLAILIASAVIIATILFLK